MRRLALTFLVLTVAVFGSDPDPVSLDASRAQDRYEAARRLGAQGSAARASVPALVAALNDEESWVAAEAARALVRIGAIADQVPALVRFLVRSETDVAQLIGEVLAGIGRPATAPLLKRLAKGDDPRERMLLLSTLAQLGRHAAEATPALLDMTGDANPGVARRAGEALRRVGPWSADFVPDIVDRLRFAQVERVRLAAARTLGRVGPAAAAAIPHLKAMRQEENATLQQGAAEALRRIDVLRRGEPAHADLRKPHRVKFKAPPVFRVRFETTKGPFVVEFTRDWAPHGVDRVYGLLQVGYFRDLAFFRVMEGFVAQFGIHGDAKVSTAWQDANLADDEPKQSNLRGTLTFAHAGPGTRSTQLFINLADNRDLDRTGFAPLGRVVEGMDVMEKLHADYGDGPPRGTGPDQDKIQYEGNRYLAREFPRLDYLERAVLLEPEKKQEK